MCGGERGGKGGRGEGGRRAGQFCYGEGWQKRRGAPTAEESKVGEVASLLTSQSRNVEGKCDR